MGKLSIMTPKSGDETLEWDQTDPESVKTAESKFNDLKEKGHKMFSSIVEKSHKKGDEIKEFDPSLDGIIAVPAMAGG